MSKIWQKFHFIQFLFSFCRSRRLWEFYREVHECHPNHSGGGQPDNQIQVLHTSGRLLPYFSRCCHWGYSMARNNIRNDCCSCMVLVYRSGKVCVCVFVREIHEYVYVVLFLLIEKHLVSISYTHIHHLKSQKLLLIRRLLWNKKKMDLFLVAQMVKSLPAKQETQVRILGQKEPLEKGVTTHSSILAWRISWTEESGRLQSMGSQRVRLDWVTNTVMKNSCLVSNFIPISRLPKANNFSSLS